MKKTSLEFELMLCTLYGIYYQRPAQHLSARVTDSISNHKAKFKKPWNWMKIEVCSISAKWIITYVKSAKWIELATLLAVSKHAFMFCYPEWKEEPIKNRGINFNLVPPGKGSEFPWRQKKDEIKVKWRIWVWLHLDNFWVQYILHVHTPFHEK